MSLISRKEVSETYNISKATIKSWIEYGLIKVAHFDAKNKIQFFNIKDIEDLLKTGHDKKESESHCTFCKTVSNKDAILKELSVTYPLFQNTCWHSKKINREHASEPFYVDGTFCYICNKFLFKILLCPKCLTQYDIKNTSYQNDPTN